eukprot:10761130-Heterocapsa_arctica.AAC.1
MVWAEACLEAAKIARASQAPYRACAPYVRFRNRQKEAGDHSPCVERDVRQSRGTGLDLPLKPAMGHHEGREW